jgi:hypothetical protein
MELERIPLRLHDVLQRVLVLLRTMADERLVDLTLEIAPDAPDDVVGDPMRLSQVGAHKPQLRMFNDILFSSCSLFCAADRPEPHVKRCEVLWRPRPPWPGAHAAAAWDPRICVDRKQQYQARYPRRQQRWSSSINASCKCCS